MWFSGILAQCGALCGCEVWHETGPNSVDPVDLLTEGVCHQSLQGVNQSQNVHADFLQITITESCMVIKHGYPAKTRPLELTPTVLAYVSI